MLYSRAMVYAILAVFRLFQAAKSVKMELLVCLFRHAVSCRRGHSFPIERTTKGEGPDEEGNGC